ncbi:MAG: hypothetical protein MUC48_27710 [Leptolyngbya sp. Prado105]|nr:hypothetical protein [Leptolyngbya sp. Prado105]
MEAICPISVQPGNLPQLLEALTQLAERSAELEIWKRCPEVTRFEITTHQEYDDSEYFSINSLTNIEFRSEDDKRRILVAADILEQADVDWLDDQPYDILDCLDEVNDHLEITAQIASTGIFERPKHLKSLTGQLSVAICQTLANYQQGQKVFLVKEPVIEHDDENYSTSGETVVGVHYDRRGAVEHLKSVGENQLDWLKGNAEDITWENPDFTQAQIKESSLNQLLDGEAAEFLPSIEVMRMGERS